MDRAYRRPRADHVRHPRQEDSRRVAKGDTIYATRKTVCCVRATDTRVMLPCPPLATRKKGCGIDGEAVPACGLLYSCKYRHTTRKAEILQGTQHRRHGEPEQTTYPEGYGRNDRSQLTAYLEGNRWC